MTQVKIDYEKVESAKSSLSELLNTLDSFLIIEDVMSKSTGGSHSKSLEVYKALMSTKQEIANIITETIGGLETINNSFQGFESDVVSQMKVE